MQQINSKLDLQQALKVAQQSALNARELLLDYFGHLERVSYKAQSGLVSEADVESEKLIIGALKKSFPDHAFLGEEESYISGKKITSWEQDRPLWVIDPLDGTTNYVHRFPIFCISIGLWHEGRGVLGVIDVPVLKDTYTAIIGQGAFKNQKIIKVSTRETLKDSLLATGFYTENPDGLKQQIRIFTQLISQTRGIRRAGAAAYDLCMVAEGIFDAFWEKDLQPWDTAAGSVLVTEAGGKTSSFDGQKFNIFDRSILATNALLHPTIQKEIKGCL